MLVLHFKPSLIDDVTLLIRAIVQIQPQELAEYDGDVSKMVSREPCLLPTGYHVASLESRTEPFTQDHPVLELKITAVLRD